MHYKTISQDELDAFLRDHDLWLTSSQKKGRTFSAINLSFNNLDFNRASLVGGNLVDCQFINANLQGCNMESINISNSDFSGADLSGANLRRTDAKYCVFSDATNLDNTILEGMMLDMSVYNYLSHRVPLDICESFQIVDINNVVFVLQYEDELQQFVAEEMVGLFTDTVKHKYGIDGSNIKTQGSRVICTIGTVDESTKIKVLGDKEKFVNYLIKIGGLEEFVLDKLDQQMIGWKLDRILSDAKMYKELADGRKLQLAEKHNTIVTLKNEVGKLTEVGETFTLMATQLKQQQLLLSDKASSNIIRLSLRNGSVVTLNSEEVIFAELDKEIITVHTTSSAEALQIRGLTFKELGEKLATANPKNILSCHKNFILNVSKVTSQIRQGNNIICSVLKSDNKTAMIIIGQNHVARYREMTGTLEQ